jgi:hypothetical protein
LSTIDIPNQHPIVVAVNSSETSFQIPPLDLSITGRNHSPPRKHARLT